MENGKLSRHSILPSILWVKHRSLLLQNGLSRWSRKYLLYILHRLASSPRFLPIVAYRGRLQPKRVLFFRFQVYERVGISLVEVYERIGNLVRFVYKRSSKMVYKRIRDWTLERGFPYKTLLSIPRPFRGQFLYHWQMTWWSLLYFKCFVKFCRVNPWLRTGKKKHERMVKVQSNSYFPDENLDIEKRNCPLLPNSPH